jgi:hypothetical protein
MSTRLFRILTALCGILGVIMLITSFAINPGPGPNPTVAQLIEFGKHYRNVTLWGAWLQTIGSLLCVLFAFAIVHLAGATTRLAGWMTMFGGIVLEMVSIIEVTFYLSAVNGNPATTSLISLDLIAAIQHLFPIVAAPAVFLPLGVVILGSPVLPHVFGYASLALGGVFAIAGLLFLFIPILLVVIALSFIQSLWFLTAAITLLVRAGKASNSVAGQQREGVTA